VGRWGILALLGHQLIELDVREIPFPDEDPSQRNGLALAIGNRTSTLDEGFAELIGGDQSAFQQHFPEQKLLSAVIRIQRTCHAPPKTLNGKTGSRRGPPVAEGSRKSVNEKLHSLNSFPKVLSYAALGQI
jgi:hypothetical protein